MKITLIGTLPPIKGISPYCLELANSLSKKLEVEFIGFKKIYPEILYPGGTKSSNDNYKKPNKTIDIKSIITYYNPFSWIQAGLTSKGDIIHVQWWAHVLAPIYLSFLSIYKLRRKKIVITVHNIIPHESSRFNKFLNGIILSFADVFIVHTSKNKSELSKVYGINHDKIHVIPHGILDISALKGISKESARDILNIPQDKKVILHFGIIREYKGLDILLKSLKLVKEDINDILLVIAGKSWVDWSTYEDIIIKYNLEHQILKNISYIPTSDIESYFSAADVVVLPYKYFDSQSGVGAVSLSFKKPLLVTEVGGLPDFVKDKRAIAKAKDANDLAKKLVTILNDEFIMEKLSKDSEELANKYNWDKIADNTIDLYKGL